MDFTTGFLLVSLIFGAGTCGYAYFLFRKNEELEQKRDEAGRIINSYQKRFKGVIDADQEVLRLTGVSEAAKIEVKESKETLENLTKEMDGLIKQVALFKEITDLAEVGIYEPHFDLDTSDLYKSKISNVRHEQKLLTISGSAVVALKEWTVEGSAKEGKKMVKKAVQLTARAFNNECESCILNVTWANVKKMEDRIKKAYLDINKFNEINQIKISKEYLDLKIDELHLWYEWKKKKQEEKEEQAEIRRQMREEEKAEREAAAALAKTKKEEELYESLLRNAKKEAQAASAILDRTNAEHDREKLRQLEENLFDLEQKLAEAHAKNERALSMAQQTKSGHVYVISNVGSFGDGVYKIGMTRRLDPQDRVDELGDASVPFCFDVHAMIHSDNAPEMERLLHKAFEKNRVNRVNLRKEFFKISLDEIREQVVKISPEALITTTAAADEFLQSKAIIMAEGKEAQH